MYIVIKSIYTHLADYGAYRLQMSSVPLINRQFVCSIYCKRNAFKSEIKFMFVFCNMRKKKENLNTKKKVFSC